MSLVAPPADAGLPQPVPGAGGFGRGQLESSPNRRGFEKGEDRSSAQPAAGQVQEALKGTEDLAVRAGAAIGHAEGNLGLRRGTTGRGGRFGAARFDGGGG